MITQELLDYVRARLEAGESREAISQSLAQNGWQADAIAEAWKALDTPQNAPAETTALENLVVEEKASSPELSPATTTASPSANAGVDLAVADSHLHLKVMLLVGVLALLLAGGAYFYWNSLQTTEESQEPNSAAEVSETLPEGIEAISPMEDSSLLEDLPSLDELPTEEEVSLEEVVLPLEEEPETSTPTKVPAPKVKVKPSPSEDVSL